MANKYGNRQAMIDKLIGEGRTQEEAEAAYKKNMQDIGRRGGQAKVPKGFSVTKKTDLYFDELYLSEGF